MLNRVQYKPIITCFMNETKSKNVKKEKGKKEKCGQRR